MWKGILVTTPFAQKGCGWVAMTPLSLSTPFPFFAEREKGTLQSTLSPFLLDKERKKWEEEGGASGEAQKMPGDAQKRSGEAQESHPLSLRKTKKDMGRCGSDGSFALPPLLLS